MFALFIGDKMDLEVPHIYNRKCVFLAIDPILKRQRHSCQGGQKRERGGERREICSAPLCSAPLVPKDELHGGPFFDPKIGIKCELV